MAVAGVLATALNSAAAHPKGLFVGGVDVIKSPGTGGNAYGTPIESVDVTEAGPDGVSQMTFTIDDPGLVITLAVGQEVRFHNFTLDYPIFFGFVQSWELRPGFGDTGRIYDVIAVGIETVLDWGVTTVDLTFAANFLTTAAAKGYQSVVANSQGLGPIRAFSAGGGASSQANPIQDGDASTGSQALTIPAGTTTREACRMIWQSLLGDSGVSISGTSAAKFFVTVDFYYGLRIFQVITPPPDYGTLTIVDAAPFTLPAGNLTYHIDASSDVPAVFVKGTGVSLSVSKNGLPGQTAVISDSTITTIGMALAAANQYLLSFVTGLRGSFDLEDRAPDATIHPGGITIITDARAGLTGAENFTIMQIQKRFNPSSREDWAVSFGGMAPSAMNAMRRLTRSTLS